MKKWILLSVLVLGVVGGAVLLKGCASSLPNRSPLSEAFPSVQGESLTGESVTIPDDFAGAPVVLLIGYAQDAQFDADRWLYGLLQSEVKVAIREVPTLEGLMPGLFAGTIDGGMRKGIPSEDWSSVVTVYGDAEKIVSFTGNQNPNNIRVLLLDKDGKVVWHHDRGYSAGVMLKLKAKVESLGGVR